MKWDPQQYLKFSGHRDRPYFDLTGRVFADAPKKVVDLGCGPGNLTKTLADRWPDAQVVGLDASPEMIATAQTEYADIANLSFDEVDAKTWLPEADVDVIVSNAMLHWIPEHAELMGRWLDQLTPGAWFAVQVPGNFGAQSHAIMHDLAESPRWSSLVGGVLRHKDAVHQPHEYLHLLRQHGMTADVWETTYSHILPANPERHPVLEWTRGTTLRPLMAAFREREQQGRLTKDLNYQVFEAEYERHLVDAYPLDPSTKEAVFFFRRIFVVGQKLEG
ncbi:trans-aconitate 2-methyltransferase [Neomicrococcus aestuarii]|uniref:Trans-aconitate 2-methyltransferase n=1 Tax=Neomicrococcus aestuarii TaxID=556325 RepID=A0A7W8WY02_9MICC|nr:methyltransferase domain-containing protein [Neomicrococcus aestuarii]MBB5511806.1 trans-aconitate 2-methyltransferase [Neomicrococcus aestuarii]